MDEFIELLKPLAIVAVVAAIVWCWIYDQLSPHPPKEPSHE